MTPNPMVMSQASEITQAAPALPSKVLCLARWLVLILSSLFLFWGLGHYALWDDEALTALVAQGVLRTGDTTANLGENLVAYRDGLMLRDGRERTTPPLPSYLTAASMALFGHDAWAARFPFALAGLACVSLVLFWARSAPARVQGILFLAILGNVSFFLFCRQCRYYALALLLSVAIAGVYERWQNRGKWKWALLLSLLFTLLYATHSLIFLSLVVAFTGDFLIFRRRRLTLPEWAALLGPQLIFTGGLAAVWNPLLTDYGGYLSQNSLWDRVVLFGWNLRDLSIAEFWVAPLVLLAVVLALQPGQHLLRRLLLGALLYLLVTAAISPQPVGQTSLADVRYLLPLIPVGWVLGAMTLARILKNWPRGAVLVASAVIFFSNMFHGSLWQVQGIRFTAWDFARELVRPIQEPYTPVAEWLNKEVPAGSTVVVFPLHMMYPLMFHAPHVIYGWQLSPAMAEKFPDLPAIHFQGQGQPPDYFVFFGPHGISLLPELRKKEAEWGRYEIHRVIPVFWKDLYRPELPWRTFVTLQNFSLENQAIYLLRAINSTSTTE
jgi:hypothetical protein